MDDNEDDDFGGFEVADSDDDPLVDDTATTSNSGAGGDISALPWLAASLQASVQESASPGSTTAPISSLLQEGRLGTTQW